MTALDVLVLALLAIAILDKLADLDHECWRAGCQECVEARVARSVAGRSRS